MREVIQLDIVREILTEYNDDIPVHFFLKDFYKKHKQFGARDRRFYSDVIYKYFRCKTLFLNLLFEEKLCYSGFLTSSEVTPFYDYLISKQHILLPLKNNWNKSVTEKLNIVLEAGKITWDHYFPAGSHIDESIEKENFFRSHLTQPGFFIRVPKKHIQETVQKLTDADINFSEQQGCFALASQLDLSKYLPDELYEVQDLTSQNTLALFELTGSEQIWDCCSGAGGKSLMLKEVYPELQLFCSDKRSSILENLKSRFAVKHIKPAGVNVFDIVKNRSGLSFNEQPIPENFFDLILADVPCSGSGTWGRNPERLYQFKEEEIAIYSNLQKSVIENALKYLKPGGLLVYITCSVYKEENSLNVQSFEKFGLRMQIEKHFIGYDKHADTMYGAVLKKI